MRDRSTIVICLLLMIAFVLLMYGINVGVNIGAEWYNEKATHEWHMNNYFVIDGKYAYSIFGLTTLAFGGLCTGLALSVFWTHRKTIKQAILHTIPFFAGIILSGLGFNTLNFMLGSFYWTNMQYPPPVIVPIFGSVDVWNFYFFLFVIPLWTGGLFFGVALAHYLFIYRQYQAGSIYAAEKKLDPMIHMKKEYIAESAVLSRNWNDQNIKTNQPSN